MSAIKLLFDRVLTLDEGEQIVLKFKTKKDLMSKKVMLFREKKEYEKMMQGASFKSFFIGQHIDVIHQVFELKLSTNGTSLDWLTDAIIKTRGGGEKALDLTEKAVNVEKERIKKLQSM